MGIPASAAAEQGAVAQIEAELGRIEGLGDLLDAQWEVRAEPRFLSDYDDELRSIERGYGEAQRPEDYLEGFSAFVRDPGNDQPALTLVLTRPWELSRKDLRELRLALDQRGYSETTLATTWREITNQEMVSGDSENWSSGDTKTGPPRGAHQAGRQGQRRGAISGADGSGDGGADPSGCGGDATAIGSRLGPAANRQGTGLLA